MMKKADFIPFINLPATFSAVFLALLLGAAPQAGAQLPCLDVTTACVEHPTEPNTYRCIAGPAKVSDLIANGTLKSQFDATFMPQRIVVKGVLTVDIQTASGGYTFCENSEIVFADAYGEIIVNPDCKLTLDKVSAHGCTTIWSDIKVSSSGTLIVKNECRFKDGFHAIVTQQNANISVTNSYFEKNLVALNLIGPGINYTSGGGIWGNTIDGTGILKPPYDFYGPGTGIAVSGATMTIGNWSANPNKVKNFVSQSGLTVNGVSLYSATATLQNIEISGISPTNATSTDQSNSGIFCYEGSTLILTGSSEANTISNCNTGILQYKSNIDLDNVTMDGVDEGIVYGQAINQTTTNYLKVKNSTFKGYITNAITVEDLYGPLKLSAFEINKCTFNDNSSAAAPPSNWRHAIYVRALFPSTGSGYKFMENKFYLKERGIYLSNIHGGLGQQNEMYAGSSNYVTGVLMDACNGMKWYSNTLTGGQIGFHVSNSPSCTFGCNTFNNSAWEMGFQATCNATNLYNNNFTGSPQYYNLYLSFDGTTIGSQKKKYNKWTGTPGQAEAHMDFTNYTPTNPVHIAQVKKSEFIIQTSNQNTVYWADPRHVGPNIFNPVNDPNWFTAATGPNYPQVYACPLIQLPTDKELDNLERSIVDNTFIPWGGYPANTWDASFLLYERISLDPDLKPSGSTEELWYNNNYNSNIGKMWRVYNGYVALSTGTPVFTASQLTANLNAISVSTTYEQNLKTVLGIFLAQYGSGTPFSPVQSIQLMDIAGQCRYEGGIGVVLARLALGPTSVVNGECSLDGGNGGGGKRIDATATAPLSATVYPNPAKDAFTVELSSPLEAGTARLVDLNGRVIGSWEFSGSSLNVNEPGFAPGIYMLEVREKENVISRNKIVFGH